MWATALAFQAVLAGADRLDEVFNNSAEFWNAYRDPTNGLYCDTLSLNDNIVCGPPSNTRYSSASTGMGLVADCVFAELGLLTKAEAADRSQQTIDSLREKWPKERFSGFYVHWTSHRFDLEGEFSTVDTAELAMGMLFAGNYHGGGVLSSALALARNVSWSKAIESATTPGIFPVVDGDTGVMSGSIRPFNEYYIVAYLAMLLQPNEHNAKAKKYFETYFSSSGAPTGRGGYPYHLTFNGHEVLSDNPSRYMSSFIPQFCFFLCRGFHSNRYYSRTLLPAWLKADQSYFSSMVNSSSRVWGVPVQGRVFGAGAGQCPSGYCVDRIAETPDKLVFSTAIMAGFLSAAPSPSDPVHLGIVRQLTWLYEHDVCVYNKQLGAHGVVKVMWRCSLAEPEWRAPAADSIDYSTFVLGYALRFLPPGWYSTYAA